MMKLEEKLNAFCHVEPEAVISAHDVSNLYQIPISFEKQGVRLMIAECIGVEESDSDGYLEQWREMADRVDSLDEEVRIAVVGKYTGLSDFTSAS